MLGEPANLPKATHRPPSANHLEVRVPALAGENLVQVLGVPKCEGGEVVLGVALAGLGPVDVVGVGGAADAENFSLSPTPSADSC